LISCGLFASAAAAAQPTNTTPPSISGTPQIGVALTEVAGGWSGNVGSVAVQWEDCPSSLPSGCTPIPNSPTTQGSQYAPTSGDLAQWITVVETATDAEGKTSTDVAAPVGPVAPAPHPVNSSPPSISGTPQVGLPLSEIAGGWSGSVGTAAVQWEDCPSSLASSCAPIPGAPGMTGSQYTPTIHDIGQWITVVETATNAEGNSSTAVATPVGPITQGVVTATMQWTFYYTPTYTSILALTVSGLSPGMSVSIGCHGHGCPFARRSLTVTQAQACDQRHTAACTAQSTLNLRPPFRRHRLAIGARITIAITRSGAIGKYYRFRIQPRQGPRIKIACLAPGATAPAGAC
jgi:hypothetical protein